MAVVRTRILAHPHKEPMTVTIPSSSSPPLGSPEGDGVPEFKLHSPTDPSTRHGASGPLPSPGETLVGVLDSQWPLSNPRGLLPGDIILRIGYRGHPGTLRAPFSDGLATVRRDIQQRIATEDVVLLQVLRGSSKLELLVSLAKARESGEESPSRQRSGGRARAGMGGNEGKVEGGEAQAEGQAESKVEGEAEEARDLLEGVVLGEGSHSMFAPLAARTEHNILRLERLKAYGLPQDMHMGSPTGAGHPWPGVEGAKGPKRALWFSRRKTPRGEGRKGGAGEDGDESGEGTEGSGEEEDPRGQPQVHRLMAGSLLAVAPGVMLSDPFLVQDDDETCLLADALCNRMRFDPAAAAERMRLHDTTCSVASADTSQHLETLSGPLVATALSAPSTSIGQGVLPGVGPCFPGTAEAQDLDGALFRLYTRPNSPLKRLARQGSQPELGDKSLAQAPALVQAKHQQASGSPPASARGLPAFQVRRRRIPEASAGKSGAVDLGHGPASLFTVLILPSESSGNGGRSSSGLHRRFTDVNHTVERATQWFAGVKKSGAAMDLMNVQTEVLPLRLGGMDTEKLAKVAQYGKWIVKTGDSARGDHISVLRAVRLWLVPLSEVELTLCISTKEDSCPDWGIQLAQTAQGIIHVSTVAAGSAADKAGVRMLLRMAEAKQQLLVLSKIQSHVLIPSMISDDGIDCVDVDAIHEQLILHAHLQSPLQLTFAL